MALLPFATVWRPALPSDRLIGRVSLVELGALLTIGAWLMSGGRALWGRLPSRAMLLALGAFLAATIAASVAADPPSGVAALAPAARLGLALGVFLVAHDLAQEPRAVRGLLLALLVGGTAAAIIGAWVLLGDDPAPAAGSAKVYRVGDALRLTGTWAHPNIAAQAWSVSLLAGSPCRRSSEADAHALRWWRAWW